MLYNVPVHKKRTKLPWAKIVIFLMLFAFLFGAFIPLFASFQAKAIDIPKGISLHEKQELLNNLTKKKSNIKKKLKEAKEKESFEIGKLNGIQRELARAQRKLENNKNYLLATQSAWQKTKDRLGELEEQEGFLKVEAKNRVKAIYQNQRVRLIDGILNSESVTDFVDQLYYQQKVLDYDKQVLKALVDQSANIKKYNATLAKEAKKMSEITRRLQDTQKAVAKQKNAQSKLVQKLKSETAVYAQAERQLEKESMKLIYKITELSGSKMDNPDATGKFVYPVKARITSPYGPRRHPVFGVRSMHTGIDLGAPRNTSVKASEGGLVIYSGWYGGYGQVVILDHSKGYSTLYAHLGKIKAKVGQRIRQGQTVGYEGSTGYATGPHLHFEVRSKGRPQNPVYYLDN